MDEGVEGMRDMALLEEGAAAKAEATSIRARTGDPKPQLLHRPACGSSSRLHKVVPSCDLACFECLLALTLLKTHTSRSSACWVVY